MQSLTMSFLLTNKGAHMYNGNIEQCIHCKCRFKSEKTLLNHKCPHCVDCSRTFSTYQRLCSHKCLCTSTNIVACTGSSSKQLCSMIDNALLVNDDVICHVLRMLQTSYLDISVGVILPAEGQVLLNYTVKPRPRVTLNQHSVNIHFTNGHWLTSWQDPCHRTIFVFDSLSSPNRIQEIMPALQLFYHVSQQTVIYEHCLSQQTQANCGVYATAYAFYCCQHINPKYLHFDESQMRQHLKNSITENKFLPFPTLCTEEGRKQQHRMYMQNKRKSEEYHKKEKDHKQSDEYKQQYRVNMHNKRKSEEYQKKEKGHKQSDEYKQQYRVNMHNKRKSEEYQKKEKGHKQSDEYKQQYRVNMHNKRKSEEYQKKEKGHKQSDEYKQQYRVNMHNKRKSEEYQKKEKDHKQSNEYKQQYRVNMQNKRKTEEYQKKEKGHKQSDEYKQQYRVNMKNKRKTEEYQKKEKGHKQSTQYKKQEQENKQNKRKSEEYQEKETQSKRQRRKTAEYKKHELELKEKRLEKNMISNFHNNVKKGPVYICTCCDQLWYRNSVTKATLNMSNGYLKKQCITGQLSTDGCEYICSTCKQYLLKNRLPPLSKANGVTFPPQPPELDITQMEERLVAARIPFMQLRELPRGGQVSLTGNIVNVPTNVNRTVTSLPRVENDDECIAVKLKRKLSYKSHYSYEYIRPNKVKEAITYLVHNSSLYQAQGITINEDWSPPDIPKTEGTSYHPHDANISEEETPLNINPEGDINQPLNDATNGQDEQEQFDRDLPDSVNAGSRDTMLQPIDMMEDSRDILSVAPGEGSCPLSIFLDRNAESLAFPSLFCGEERKQPQDYNVKVYMSDLFKSELRRADRRVAGHIGDIFFKLKSLQMKHILDKGSICLRKTTNSNQDLTAGFLKQTQNLNKLLHTDLGFRIFRDLRGSPPYWEKVKKDLFALIRFLGIPTWFTSFSSADTHWTHLLQILGQTVDNKSYTEEQVKEFTWFKKQELVKKDPVTCARHFDYQVRTFISSVLCNSSNPVGPIEDFFYKVEFQMRGSPHIHMLIWIKDAPHLDEDDEETVVEFVNKYVTCNKSEDMADLVQVQMHAHSRTCKKNNNPVCRFNFPIPPMEETSILYPLQAESEDDKKVHEQNWKQVAIYLKNLKPENSNMSFKEFLAEVQLDKEMYIKAVSSSISAPKLFLKRRPSEVRVNSYNSTLLKAWRANMDLQYVLDAYSCAMYIVSYVAKSQRGMSNLMYHAAKEAREGNKDIREQVKFIGNKFLNNVEISAQEAVYYVLQIPLYKSSRDVQFINTSPVDKRTVMLKDFTVIENMEDDCPDVIAEGVLNHYASRPTQLELTCLADYVSNFRRVKNYKSNKLKNTNNSHNSDEEDIYEKDQDSTISAGDGYSLHRRKRQQSIRYVRYHPDKDPENYYRETLMLFVPWRNENEIKGDSQTYSEQFHKVINTNDELTAKMTEYKHKCTVLDDAIQDVEDMPEEILQEGWNEVAPNTEHIEEQCAEIDFGSRSHQHDDTDTRNEESAELNTSLGISNDNTRTDSFIINMIPDSDYYQLVASLNKEQTEFFYYVLDRVKNHSDIPFYVYLGGGAGVGKTAVTIAIYQMLLRNLNKIPGANPDDLKVLLGAPTGKAAFLIGGNTLHHLFHIPASQGFEYKRLAHEKLNTLRCQFAHIKVLIIDEVSMVGNKMLNFINQRLKEIMGNTKDFGGISVIAVGDFYQLKPVFDGWIFQNLTNDYGPLARNLWTDLFSLFCLTQIMRQKDDLTYALLLNRLRTGIHTSVDIDLLKKRIVSGSVMSPDYPKTVPHIFLTNEAVDAHNQLVFTLANSYDQITVKAWDVVIGDKTETVKEKILQRIPNSLSKTMGLCGKLQISVGSRVEISTNVDVQDGLANGASGVVMTVTNISNTLTGATIWIKFDSEDIGKKLRQSVKQTGEIRKGWTPITQIKRQFAVGSYKNAEVLRAQFPLRPSAAKTAHRCQGDTMQAAVVDFKGRTQCHSHYVALSRVKCLDNLHILTLNESSIRINKEVTEEMQRMTTTKYLHHTLQFPMTSVDHFLILFHNVRSLKPYFQNIANDPYFLLADIMIFAESRLMPRDTENIISIPGYNTIRHDCEHGDTPMYGIILYTRLYITDTEITKKREIYANSALIECIVVNCHVKLEKITIIGLYASPKISPLQLRAFLNPVLNSCKNEHMIVLGDFNIDLFKNAPIYSPSYNCLRQCVQSGTTDQSLLDHIYTNIPNDTIDTGVFETYFSDHKPVWATIKNKHS